MSIVMVFPPKLGLGLMQFIPLFFTCSVLHLFNEQIFFFFPTKLDVLIKMTNLFPKVGVCPRPVSQSFRASLSRTRFKLPQGMDRILLPESDAFKDSAPLTMSQLGSICAPSGTPSGEKAAVLCWGGGRGPRAGRCRKLPPAVMIFPRWVLFAPRAGGCVTRMTGNQ